MLINIFCFCYLFVIPKTPKSSFLKKGVNLTYKRLKIRKLHKKSAVFPAFQSTILRTFFELAKKK